MKKNILLLVLFAMAAAMPVMAEESAFETDFAAEAEAQLSTEMDAEFQNVQIAVEGSQVRVTNAEGLSLEVYNLTGVRISATKIESEDVVVSLNLQHGCYILKVGKVVRKISIR
ncbi:MAG: T9SS type A sorting domain-containing protein [Bacteroidaceae bacterium]|nr:T9SS type A sorting domain-containing protein [Bacteroidaceae bacterium]